LTDGGDAAAVAPAAGIAAAAADVATCMYCTCPCQKAEHMNDSTERDSRKQ